MKQFVFFFALLLLCAPQFVDAASDEFVYPLGRWDVSTHHNDEIGDGIYHMGVDAGFLLGAGAPVYAVSDGVVKEAQERSQFGLVILIEHTLSSGKKIVSLYGHVDPNAAHVTPGQQVSIGDAIGSLGDSTVNGGWAPHIHFGIQRSPYSSTWIYYGHVRDPDTAADWYDPETFIPNHLAIDRWAPDIAWDITRDQFISNTFTPVIRASDVGGGVSSLTVQVSTDNQATWTTVTSASGLVDYPYQPTLNLASIADSTIHLRVIATDAADHTTTKIVRVVKKQGVFTTPHVAALVTHNGTGVVSITYESGDEGYRFRAFGKRWAGYGDVTVGDVTGNGANNVVVVNGGPDAVVKIFTRTGTKLAQFKAFGYGKQRNARIAVGDVTGDGTDEIIVGSGAGIKNVVKVFSRSGALLWKTVGIPSKHKKGLDVATGDITGDGIADVVVGSRSGAKPTVAVLSNSGARLFGFRAFGANYRHGVNVGTCDVTGNGKANIIVSSNGATTGIAKVYTPSGTDTDTRFVPFGDSFTGAVDTSCVQWDAAGAANELQFSQASQGEAWVKTYRYDDAQSIVFERRLFDDSVQTGARIGGWD